MLCIYLVIIHVTVLNELLNIQETFVLYHPLMIYLCVTLYNTKLLNVQRGHLKTKDNPEIPNKTTIKRTETEEL